MGPTSYVSFPGPHKVPCELQPYFQADLKKKKIMIQDTFLEALKFFLQKLFIVDTRYFLFSIVA